MSTFFDEVRSFVYSERKAPEYTQHQHGVVARYAAGATSRLNVARELSTPLVVPALLLRDAIQLLVRAVTAGRERDATCESLAQRNPIEMVQALRAAAARPTDDDSRRVDEALATTEPLYFDSLEEAELGRVQEALTREADWLRHQIDLRSAAHVKATKIGRQAAFVLLIAYLGYALIAKALAPKNLAFGRPVRASSHQAGTPDPAGLVDGRKKTDKYGLCTDISLHDPWAIVDLGRDLDIHEIVVYNRGDSNLDDGLPYALDLSVDGHDYHEVAQRDAHFGDGGFLSPPWTAKVRGRARYVRVRARGYIALDELEVF
jgi:hypothetical protein